MTISPLRRRPDPALDREDGSVSDVPPSRTPVGPGDGGALSLASGRPGDLLRIREIFFALVRDRCRRLGLTEGDVVQFREADSDRIRIHHARVGSITLDPRIARFVLVRRVSRPAGRGSWLKGSAGPGPERWPFRTDQPRSNRGR